MFENNLPPMRNTKISPPDWPLGFLAREVQEYLLLLSAVSSKTTPNQLKGNIQVERYNGIIWKAIFLTLKSQNLPLTHSELVLPNATHSIRSILSTVKNITHETFSFFWQLSNLLAAKDGQVFLCMFAKHSKNNPLVQEVELQYANPNFTHIRYADGLETTVLLR